MARFTPHVRIEKVVVLRDFWLGNDNLQAGSIVSMESDTVDRLMGVKAVSRKLPEVVEELKEEKIEKKSKK
jgi:hypothetical protein